MNIDLSFINNGAQAGMQTIGKLKDKCYDVYNNLDGSHIKNIYHKIDSNIKNGIMKNIGGIDLYDYSGISEPVYRLPYNKLHINSINYREFEIMTLKDFLNYFCKNINEDVEKFNTTQTDKFLIMIKDEKVILHYTVTTEFDYDSKERKEGLYKIDYIFVTNYGKLIQFTGIENHKIKKSASFDKCNYEENEFWIPIDYIKIIKLIKPLMVSELLKNIKRILYDRKFIPLYIKDALDENKKLKVQYDEYQTNMIEFEKGKMKFEVENKPYIDLILEKEKLKKLKTELDDERNKLKLVKIKLDMDRQNLDKEMEKIQSINVDDILK